MINISPEMKKKLILSVGTHLSNRPLSPIEVAHTLEEALKTGVGRQELASFCNINISMIPRFLKLLSLPESIWHLIDWGNDLNSISFSVAYQVAGINDKEGQEEIICSTLEYKLTRLEVQDVVQVIKRAKVSATEAIRRILKLRRTIEKYHLFIGQILSNEVKGILRNISQPERDNLFKSAIRNYSNNVAIEGVKLGAERFSLIVQENIAPSIANLQGGFEIAVNDFLQKEVHDRFGASN